MCYRDGPAFGEDHSMGFSEVTWEQFIRAITSYRDAEFTARSPIDGERAYLALTAELAEVPLADRGAHVNSIVLFLNRWRCRFPTEASRAAIASWISREAGSLEAISGRSILDPLGDAQEEFDRLHESLIALRRGDPAISTMGVACASKLLHQMVPPLFVMWDDRIRIGRETYGEFMVRMHGLALRLRDELSPEEARPDMDGYLQRLLGYPVRKPLAKYIDEFNWWLAWPRPA
jgi:hypothetical protein